ncbi:phage tail protein [Vibrio diabolicus]|uniref:phage tail protein n=1 Tax=Vibrio diabolicus TaxID=50719 RepID=UPI0015F630C0|nr:tail fiber protein [Vibrio diabolicus]
MSEPFLGEIRMFAGNFAPRDWAYCDGQLIPVTQNNALYALLGTTYDGNGYTNFGLPDMRGRLPVHFGTGPDLTQRPLGARFGVETVVLTEHELPEHRHPMKASTGEADDLKPSGLVFGQSYNDLYNSGSDPSSLVELSPQAIGKTGGSQSHNNMMPSFCVNFIIALEGLFPPRS